MIRFIFYPEMIYPHSISHAKPKIAVFCFLDIKYYTMDMRDYTIAIEKYRKGLQLKINTLFT